MTGELDRFVRENRRYPVVHRAALPAGGRGATYTLSNGHSFTLTRDECSRIPDNLPWWKGLYL